MVGIENELLKPEEFTEPSVLTTPADQNAATQIIADIQAQQSSVVLPNGDGTPGVPGAPQATQEPLMSETECIATLHAIYQLVAYAMNTEPVPQETIDLRGKQFFLISQRYGLNVKYMDLVFFGIGVSSDMIIMYKNRKPTAKEQKKIEERKNLTPEDVKRLDNLPAPLEDMKLDPMPVNPFGA